MKKHSKHTAIKKKYTDTYAVNEVSILGAKCSVIKDLVYKIADNLHYKTAYFDASHAKDIAQNNV